MSDPFPCGLSRKHPVFTLTTITTSRRDRGRRGERRQLMASQNQIVNEPPDPHQLFKRFEAASFLNAVHQGEGEALGCEDD